jgi:hypothetical protein
MRPRHRRDYLIPLGISSSDDGIEFEATYYFLYSPMTRSCLMIIYDGAILTHLMGLLESQKT